MTPYWSDGTVSLHLGKAEHTLPGLPDASVDAIVTDPPYELGFMGRTWDASGIAYAPAMWAECLRVLKPGGHMVAFGGTRTYHRMVCAVEDAGFEIRDSMHWIYGSGFPKSMDVSKAIDKAAGVEREVIGTATGRAARPRNDMRGGAYGSAPSGLIDTSAITAPATEDAVRWDGWGTALKPAHEPIVLARKPLRGTVAANVLAHGTGALNIDGCRVDSGPPRTTHADGSRNFGKTEGIYEGTFRPVEQKVPDGRWPMNVVLSHPPILDDTGQPIGDACADGCVPGCPVAELDRQSGVLKSGERAPHHADNGKAAGTYGAMTGRTLNRTFRGDEGGASRFFPVFRYEAKAPASERPRLADGTAHATVKPLALMRWLVRLVTPPGATVLDPFAGSGTTGEACVIEGFRALLIEQDAGHAELIKARLSKPLQPALGFEEPA